MCGAPLHGLNLEPANHIQTYTCLAPQCYWLAISTVSEQKSQSRRASALWTGFLGASRSSALLSAQSKFPRGVDTISCSFLKSIYTFFFFFNVLWYCYPSLPRIMNSITLWWFSFKLSTTIRILPISSLLISTKSKWASQSNFLHLRN